MAWRGPTKPNTNAAPNNVNKSVGLGSEKIVVNRADDKRRDNDNQKTFSISLMDIDSTIFNHLNDVVNPTVVDNGIIMKVPINYASPERWKAVKKDGYLRDKNGKAQCPMIVFRRSSMQRNTQLSSFNRKTEITAIRGYSIKNKYDRFSLMNRFAPVREMYVVTMPDQVVINYDFVVWTDKIEQLNGIVEKINFSTRDYWGDKKRFKFRTYIDQHDFQTEVDAQQDRSVKSTFTLLVHAYLLPETYEDFKSTTQKVYSKRKVIFNAEAVSSIPTIDPQKSDLVDYSKYIIKNGANSQEAIEALTSSSGSVSTEISGSEVYVDRTDFDVGDTSAAETMNYQYNYQTKTGSVVSTDDGVGNTVVMFSDTSFNKSSIDTTYKKIVVYVDNKIINESITVPFESGSNLYVKINNIYSGVTPTTGSIVVGYGNIQ